MNPQAVEHRVSLGSHDIKLAETEICMLIPASFATGDPGTPLSNQVLAIIKAMSEICYCPCDFGEGDDNWQELWFESYPSKEEAEINVEEFISRGGYD